MEVQKSFPESRLFQQHVGKFFKYRLFDELKSGIDLFRLKEVCFRYLVSIGLPGMSDLFGIIRHGDVGIFIAIEIKTGNARQTKEQKAFERTVKSLGGIYILGRSTEQIKEEINENLANKRIA